MTIFSTGVQFFSNLLNNSFKAGEKNTNDKKNAKAKGLTLVEMMVSLALLGFMSTSAYMVMTKAKVSAATVAVRRQAMVETETVYQLLSNHIQHAVEISTQSHRRRLILTVLNPDGTLSNQQWRIQTVAGQDVLQRSEDNGVTWISPFAISADSIYRMNGGEFFFCGSGNNCTRFTDTNNNGVYNVGTDAAGTLATGYAGTALTAPNLGTKVVVSNFIFDRKKGMPNVIRQFPDTVNALLKGKPVLSTIQPVQSFNTNTAASGLPATFDVTTLHYQPSAEELWLAGTDSSGSNRLYRLNREGVFLNDPIQVSALNTAQWTSLVMDTDGSSLLGFNAATNRAVRISSLTGQVLSQLDLSAVASAIKAVAVDPSTPDDMYVLGQVAGTYRILRRNKTTGLASGTPSQWFLPAGLTNPSGMAIDPVSGAFYVVHNTVAAGNLTLYRVDPANPLLADTLTVNLAAIGSSATAATANGFGLSMDVLGNRLFLSDRFSDKVFELIPNRLLAPST
jgi:prepilin-type N-terminal cleavage/methylation domain-containing protein